MVRGEVRRPRISRDRRGSEQRGARWAVIVQGDELLALSTVLVAPTSHSAPPRSFRPIIELDGETTHVLIEQMTAVSAERLGDSAGRLSAQEMRAVDEAVAVVLGL